ncbi:ribonuclease M5 [Vagococcus lutrae]|uniref:ribonuclease M5 n=1 Tax=Vagococcus lutrae TaxID=81947 RepID=UPI000F887E6F|nr:ribonuclease M5 [Vagococcus lutrae]MDO5741861.1 ribonuclease M5 [Vagococcus sp.]RST91147.1 ribonuclease M5 [Vagococcus lutrae]
MTHPNNKKMKIEQVVVVEGKDDTKHLKQFFEVDTIETIGSAINADILEQIRLAQQVRGVIVLTDPDFPGEKIRKTITHSVPEAKHAFLTRQEATPRKKGRSLGVEHATQEDLTYALSKVMTPTAHTDYTPVSREVLIKCGLLAGSESKMRREWLGNQLRIGYTNGKQLVKRLEMFQITEEQVIEAMKKLGEQQHD